MESSEVRDKFDSLIEFSDYFKDEQTCIDYFAKKRWGDSPYCPHCGCKKIYCFSDKRRYKCSECRKQFTAKTGSLFEGTKLSLRKWFMAIYLITSHKKGISSYQLAKDLKVTQKTAWFILHRIRYGMSKGFGIRLEGDVEVDETYVGGKNKNRHWNKKVKNSQGRSIIDKTPVFGMLQRGGNVITKVIPDVRGETLQNIIKQYIKKNSRILSDEYLGYRGLEKLYEHRIVNHGAKQYVNGDIYTNTIEGFWSILKRGILGIYHQVSRKHLQKYTDEFSFRYNVKKLSEGQKVNKMLSLCCVRLKYKNLVYE